MLRRGLVFGGVLLAVAVGALLYYVNARGPFRNIPVQAPEAALRDASVPIWTHGPAGAALEAHLYIEPYCTRPECRESVMDVLPELMKRADVILKVYDYPISQEGKSFLFSAVGRCVAKKNPQGYPEFLRRGITSDAYDNNLEMQNLSRALIGEYDIACIHAEARALKTGFENKNPLGLPGVPTLIVGDKMLSGKLSLKDADSMLTQLR
jgi:protein-disulfide isomerase